MRKLYLITVFTILFASALVWLRPEPGFAGTKEERAYFVKIVERLDKVLENQNKMMEDIKDLKSKMTDVGKGDDNYQTEGTKRDTQSSKGR